MQPHTFLEGLLMSKIVGVLCCLLGVFIALKSCGWAFSSGDYPGVGETQLAGWIVIFFGATVFAYGVWLARRKPSLRD
jgi:ABC-type Mn2+/Zn2+ transport system permease subunit